MLNREIAFRARTYRGETTPPAATLEDETRYGNNGTIAGATWERLPSGLWVNSFITNDTITVADASVFQGTGDFSLEFWVYVTNFATNFMGVIWANQATTWGIQLRNTPTFDWIVTDGVGDKTLATTISAATYHHVVASCAELALAA